MQTSTKRYLRLMLEIGYSLPRLLIESRQLLRTVPNLPGAKDTTGLAGSTQHALLNVLLIGESTIDGVGVDYHHQGFAGAFAQELNMRTGCKVGWQVAAQSGFTVSRLSREIVPKIRKRDFDLIMIGVGANDAFKLSTIWKWRRSIRGLIDQLDKLNPRVPKVFINVPPIKEFPAFSPLLKEKIGLLAELLAEELSLLIEDKEHVYFNETALKLSDWERATGVYGADKYFSDGIHPSEFTYKLWAHHMVDFVLDNTILKC